MAAEVTWPYHIGPKLAGRFDRVPLDDRAHSLRRIGHAFDKPLSCQARDKRGLQLSTIEVVTNENQSAMSPLCTPRADHVTIDEGLHAVEDKAPVFTLQVKYTLYAKDIFASC